MKRSNRVWIKRFCQNILLISIFYALCIPDPSWADSAPIEYALHTTQHVPASNIYYVAKNGNDTNPGTETQPWLTIQKAANTLIAGDTVLIKTGTYLERVVPKNSGNAGAYIIYAAYPGNTTTIDGTGVSVPSSTDGLLDIYSKSYIQVSGLRVVNSQGAGIHVDYSSNIIIDHNYTDMTVSSGIGVWHTNVAIVDGNEIVRANNGGSQENLTIAGTTNFQVRYNNIHDGMASPNGGEALDIKDGSANGQVYGNFVHHGNRLGIFVDAWDKHTYNIQFFQNSIFGNTDYGFAIGSEAGGLLENIKVYNNLIYANHGFGLVMQPDGGAATHPLKDISIINNTIYGNSYNGWGGGIYLNNPNIQNVIIRNNIVSQNLEFQIVATAVVPLPQLTVEYNLIDGNQSYAGAIYGTNFVTGNPRFYNAVGADFRLMSNSPAIDTGSLIGAPSNDYAGTLRPLDGNGDHIALPDIGAFEYITFVTIPSSHFLPLVIKK